MNGHVDGFLHIEGHGRPSPLVLEPRPVGWGGTLWYWQYDRKRGAAANAAALVPRHPPGVADNYNMANRKYTIQCTDY